MRWNMLSTKMAAPLLMASQCGTPSFQSEQGQWAFTDTGPLRSAGHRARHPGP